jgi:hypothetical protein
VRFSLERKSTVKLQLAEARVKDNIEDRYGWRAEDDGNDAKYSTARLGGKLYTVSGARSREGGANQSPSSSSSSSSSSTSYGLGLLTQGFVVVESVSVNLSV